eukprot:5443015-Prymnesium_polylepis.1
MSECRPEPLPRAPSAPAPERVQAAPAQTTEGSVRLLESTHPPARRELQLPSGPFGTVSSQGTEHTKCEA